MADYDSSLPVRTETDGDVVSKIVDGAGANTWAIDANNIGQVNLNDGTNALAIGANGELTTIVTDGTDTIAIDTNGNLSTLITDGLTNLVIDQNSGSAYVAIVDSDGDMAQVTTSGQLHTVIYDGAGTNSWVVDGNGIGQVNLSDGTDTLDINTDGSLNVNVVQSTVGDDIHVYNTSAAVAPAGVSTVITYTVSTGKTLLLKSVEASGSGKAKVEVLAGTPSSETVRAVFFISTSNGFGQIVFPQPIEVIAADNVLVTMTNRDNQSQDLYAFINGSEV
jgi:hypothetical protein